MVAHLSVSTQKTDLYEIEAILLYRVSSRPAGATGRPHLKKKKKKKRIKERISLCSLLWTTEIFLSLPLECWINV